MNRQVTEQEALNLVNNVQTLMNKIEKIATKYVRIYKDNITRFADQIKEQKIIEELKKIPVEEVNKDKLGIRTKYLRDANYTNMAELYMAAEWEIANVKGIGDNVAKTIKSVTRDIALKVRKDLHKCRLLRRVSLQDHPKLYLRCLQLHKPFLLP